MPGTQAELSLCLRQRTVYSELPQENPQPISIFCISLLRPRNRLSGDNFTLTVPMQMLSPGVTVHMNPRLIVIAADADFSTGLISRLSSCDRSFLVDTCVHQFTISAVECCVSISEQDISTNHSATGCRSTDFTASLNPILAEPPACCLYRLLRLTLPGFRPLPNI